MPARVGRLFRRAVPPTAKVGEIPSQPNAYYLLEEMDFVADDMQAYLDLANPYVPQFEAMYKFQLVASGFEKLKDKDKSRCRVTHLWRMPQPNSLDEVMVALANDVEYGKIDALVGRLGYECQDIAINFGWEHSGPDRPGSRPAEGFKYVLAHHQLWTTDLNTFAWDFDFDAGVGVFVEQNDGWVHLGNRMKITGCIYDVFELWIAPKEAKDPKAVLSKAPWIARTNWDKRGLTVSVLTPMEYDHNT